jgi:hypothetical protein
VQQRPDAPVRLLAGQQPEAVEEPRQMTDLPEGLRIVLIHALELCGAVLKGDPPEELVERAAVMYAVCTEHIDIVED